MNDRRGRKTGDGLEGLRKEVEALRGEVAALGRAVRPLLAEREEREKGVTEGSGGGTSGGSGGGRERKERGRAGVSPAAHALERRARELGVSGLLTRYGYYGSANRSSTWSKEEQPAEELLRQDPVQVARVLAALGHPQRLQVLKAVLERPASAADLVERLGLGTTGQAYHHLNVLQAADLIFQEARGRFAFQAHRVQAFLTLLAGVGDALDARHSAGSWGTGNDGARDGASGGAGDSAGAVEARRRERPENGRGRERPSARTRPSFDGKAEEGAGG